MKKFKMFCFAFVSFVVIYFIFFTMNDEVAQIIFFWGLSIIGCYIYKLCYLISDKLNSIISKGRNNNEESKKQ